MDDIRKSGIEKIVPETHVGLRYKSGKFESLCTTCVSTKWNPVTEEYAMKVAKKIIELNEYYFQKNLTRM